MHIIIPIIITLATVGAMEIVANLSHKYIMHGWGWGWHESHHSRREGVFERNDLYALAFALPSIFLIYIGSEHQHLILWVGVGMTIYGFLYFLVHDGLVHNRWPFKIVPKNNYLKRLVQAHRLHHAVHGREGCVSFGFLYSPEIVQLKRELRQLHNSKYELVDSSHE